jgi:predicted metal-binding membrane protein
MVALALIIFIEKVWRYGKEFSYLVGVTLILLGCMLPWWPGILTGM